MQNPLDDWLTQQPVLILDGALATELEGRGADLRDPLWSAKILIERPDLIRSVHRDYFVAGADVATTATYQATFEGFARRGFDRRAATRLMQDAVALATAARDEFWSEPAHRIGRRRPLVAASVGPYGAMLADGSEYRGHYAISDAGLEDFHGARLEVLARAGADLLACETIPCLREALILAELLEALPMPAWISFACQDGSRNCQGEAVNDCAAALDRFDRVVALGVNCTAPRHVGALLERMAGGTRKPLLAYPNSGELYDPTHKHWHGEEAGGRCRGTRWADGALDWYRAGARLIGGCCRTSPGDIRALRAAAADFAAA